MVTRSQPTRGRFTRPADLRATHFEHGGERLLVFSYSVEAGDDVGTCEPLRDLTPAQREVVVLLLEGCSNQDIARARGTCAATVAKQIEQAYRRLGINSRRELAALVGTSRTVQRKDE